MSTVIDDVTFTRLMQRARSTNRQRDADERAVGFAAPPDAGIDLHLRTAMEAIECGLKTKNVRALAEGLAMLEVIEYKLRAAAEWDKAVGRVGR